MLCTSSTCGRARATTSDGVLANAVSLAATTKNTQQMFCRLRNSIRLSIDVRGEEIMTEIIFLVDCSFNLAWSWLRLHTWVFAEGHEKWLKAPAEIVLGSDNILASVKLRFIHSDSVLVSTKIALIQEQTWLYKRKHSVPSCSASMWNIWNTSTCSQSSNTWKASREYTPVHKSASRQLKHNLNVMWM